MIMTALAMIIGMIQWPWPGRGGRQNAPLGAVIGGLLLATPTTLLITDHL